MTTPIDAHQRIRLHLRELSAYYEVDESTDVLYVPLGDAGTASVDFVEIESGTLVILSAVILEDLELTPTDAQPLAEWTVTLRGAKLCFDSDAGTLSAQTELLGSFADPPEVGFALAALYDVLERATHELDLVGGRAPASSAGENDPSVWWPQGSSDPEEVVERVRAIAAAAGDEPVLEEDARLVFVTARGLFVAVTPSDDGMFLELRAAIAEDVDPQHPAVAETLTTNRLIAFGGLSVIPRDATVVIKHDLLSTSLDATEFLTALNSISAVADGFCDTIAQALGGRPATPSQAASGTWGSSLESSSGATASGFRLSPGSLVGEYEIEDELGSGTFGTVYRAKDPRLPRSVALKVLKPHWVFEDSVRERFLKEARLAARLNHPHLVKVHAVGEDGDFVYVAYDLVDGESLERVLEDAGGLDPARTSRLVRQIAGALQALHDEGFVHRDVKPANIMIWRPGSALEAGVLLDLGVAHGYDDPTATRQTVYAPGTMYYQAPEVERGVTADAGLDQYALALTVFEMLTGYPAFGEPEHLYDLQERKRRLEIEPLAKYGVSSLLESVLRRALRPDADRRFASVEDFADALHDAAMKVSAPIETSVLRITKSGFPHLAPYTPWQVEEVPDPLTASPGELSGPLLRIVRAEGPVVAERAFRLMLEGSGRRQLSSGIEKRLSAAVRRLVRDGHIVAEQEWGGRHSRDAVLRPAGSEPGRPRKLGPRRLDEVPPRELAAAAAIAVGRPCNEPTDEVVRALLQIYGRRRASRPFLDQLQNALERYGAQSQR